MLNYDSDHKHSVQDYRRKQRNFKIAFIITVSFTGVEFVGSLITNSLALWADAFHMLTDALAFLISYLAVSIVIRNYDKNISKPADYETIAALTNSIFLIIICLWIIFDHSYERWLVPEVVESVGTTWLAIIGLIVNLSVLPFLHGDHKHDLNTFSSWLHLVGDIAGSVVAIMAGLGVYLFDLYWIDTAGSVVISIILIIIASYLAVNSYRKLKG